jgi:exopolysaccharide biosynthesis polyprenyl glycosylphosphotransferase
MSGKSKKTSHISLLYLITDIIFIELSFLCSYWLRFYSPLLRYFETTLPIPSLSPYIYSSLIIIPIWLIFLNSKGLYSQGRISIRSEFIIPVIKSITLGMFVVLSVAFFYRNFSYSRAVFVILYFSSILFVLSGRMIIFQYEQHKYKKGLFLKNVLILGYNEFAKKVYNSIRDNEIPGYKIIGYCSNEKLAGSGFDYLGSFDELNKILTESNIDTVVAVLEDDTNIKLIDLVKGCEGYNVEFMYLPEVLGLITSKVRVKTIGGIPLIRLKEIPIGGLDYVKKRMFDILFSLIFLILTLPISIIIAILIKLESRGPLFYFQERVGLEGKVFKTIKFRSMKINAESKSGPIWAKDGDDRTTITGKFIRKFSIDEIPQFLNVLRGDMSVVGPRPERPYFVNQFKQTIPGYLERHRVRTGITGWAQVNGFRGNTPLDERIKHDIYYVENWSLLFDIIIIFKTVKEVFFSKNAY